jgi:hypothetical protein
MALPPPGIFRNDGQGAFFSIPVSPGNQKLHHPVRPVPATIRLGGVVVVAVSVGEAVWPRPK